MIEKVDVFRLAPLEKLESRDYPLPCIESVKVFIISPLSESIFRTESPFFDQSEDLIVIPILDLGGREGRRDICRGVLVKKNHPADCGNIQFALETSAFEAFPSKCLKEKPS